MPKSNSSHFGSPSRKEKEEQEQPLIKKSPEPNWQAEHFEFKTSPYRWLLILGPYLVRATNALPIMVTVPIAVQLTEIYDLSSITVVNINSISYSLLIGPLSIVAIWAASRWELSHLLHASAVLQVVGTFIRMLTIWTGQFYWLLIGVVLCAIAQPMWGACMI